MMAAILPTRWPGYLVLALLLYLVFLLVTFPAYWFSRIVSGVSRGEGLLADTRGTVWSGSGELIIQPKRTYLSVGRIVWQIQPQALLMGRLQVNINLQGTELTGKTQAGVGFSGVRIDSLDAAFPASLIGKFNAVAGFADPDGRLQIQSNGLEIRRGELLGSALINWTEAGSRNFKLTQLGDYRLSLTGKGNVAELQLTTLRGDLQLTGQGQWRADNGGVLRFQGSALAVGRQRELEPVLRLIGSQTAPDRREFSLNLPLPI